MDEKNLESATPSGNQPNSKAFTIGRRPVVKAGVATLAGLALASGYVKPSITSVQAREDENPSGCTPPTPTSTPPPPEVDGCSPGFWRNRNGGPLWDQTNDLDWTAKGGAGTNPFIHDTVFNSFFTSVSSLAGLKMWDIIDADGGSNQARQAARQLIAAYLNSSFWPTSFPYSTSQLSSMWSTAVSTGNFQSFKGDIEKYNDGGSGFCPL